MRKRLLCLTIFGFSLGTSFGQLTISLHGSPAAIVQKSQLWNITLINSGNTSITANIGLTLLDLKDNQPVMTAYARPVVLIKGVKQLKATDVAPVEYNYLSSAFDMGRVADALLPIGNYRACYTLYSSDGENVLSENCIDIEIAPLSPPQLNLPADSALLETACPQFSWLPPVPVSLFNNLNYDLLVTEVQPGQSPESAIQENLPVYSALNLTTVANNYPASTKSLDTGKIYAWRVVAKNGETFAAQTEVWTFSYHKAVPVRLAPTNGTYLELKNDNSYVGTAVIPDNILGTKFYSYDKTHDAVIRFLNEKGELVKEIMQTIVYGSNFIVFRLDHSFRRETIYFMEIPDLQGSRYRTSFRISK